MNMSTLLSMIVSWAINIIYILSLFPQLVTNYRRGSVAGMSPLMMWASWNGYALYAIYATGVDLPLPTKYVSRFGLFVRRCSQYKNILYQGILCGSSILPIVHCLVQFLLQVNRCRLLIYGLVGVRSGCGRFILFHKFIVIYK